MATLIEIVEEGLERHGYDGLYTDICCACLRGAISPGGCLSEACRPGFIHRHSITCQWVITGSKNPMSDEEIEKELDFY